MPKNSSELPLATHTRQQRKIYAQVYIAPTSENQTGNETRTATMEMAPRMPTLQFSARSTMNENTPRSSCTNPAPQDAPMNTRTSADSFHLTLSTPPCRLSYTHETSPG